MCDRTCPECGSSLHFDNHGILGSYIFCECGLVLAHRRDPESARLDEPDPEEWARLKSFDLNTQPYGGATPYFTANASTAPSETSLAHREPAGRR